MAVAVPIAIAVAAAASVAAAGVAAYGQIQQGKTADAVAQYNAELAQRNARIAERNAEQAKLAGAAREEQSRQQVRMVLARQAALAGASGVSAEGSPLLVMMESARQGELDALRLRYATGLEEQDALFAAAQQRSQAELQRFQGAQARTAGTLGAGSTLLTGFGSAGSTYVTGTRTTAGTSLIA